jgi:hypothetical protein
MTAPEAPQTAVPQPPGPPAFRPPGPPRSITRNNSPSLIP